MDVLPFPEFDRIHQQTVRDVYAHWSPAMQRRLAENCRGWAPGLFDFRNYLQASSVRFYKAYLGLEAFIAIGIVLVLSGLALDVVLAIVGVDGTGGLNYTALAAIAQTLIIVGVNAALVGFITSIIEGD